MNFFKILTTTIILSSIASVQADNVELLKNPSFENGDKAPEGWTVWGGKKTEAEWNSQARTGSKSIAVNNAAGKSGCRWITEEGIKVVPGGEYLLSGWIKTANVKGNCSLSIAWYSKKGWIGTSRSLLINRTHNWRKLSVKAIAPPKSVCAKIYVGKIRSGQGSCWFDDLSFKKVGGTSSVEKKSSGIVKISWPASLEKTVTVSSSTEKLFPVKHWYKLNPQDALELKSKSGVLSVKDTFGKYTGWTSNAVKVEKSRNYIFQAELYRRKSYNAFCGFIWLGANDKILAVSLKKIEIPILKWQKLQISAKAPLQVKSVRFFLIQRRSSGETMMKNSVWGFNK
jgi:hypothetical protein